MFAYCGNNPVNYYDPTGNEAAWVHLGFVYDGSLCDFRRLEAGLPPRAYEKWLNSEQARTTRTVVSQNANTQLVITEITNLSQETANERYIDMLEENAKPIMAKYYGLEFLLQRKLA